MFSEREKMYLKALVVSALETISREDLKDKLPQDINDPFTKYLDDYLAHHPLSDYPDEKE